MYYLYIQFKKLKQNLFEIQEMTHESLVCDKTK